MLLTVVVVEALERLQQVDNPGLQSSDPACVVRERVGQPVEHALLELGVVNNDRALVADAVAQPVQELRPRITAPVGEEGVMLRLRARHGLLMQAELKRHLLVRPQAVEQRDRRVERLEVEVADRVFQALKEAGQRLAVDMGLAGERDLALDSLPVGQVNMVGDVAQPDDAVAEQAPALLAAVIEVEHAVRWQEAPALLL